MLNPRIAPIEPHVPGGCAGGLRRAHAWSPSIASLPDGCQESARSSAHDGWWLTRSRQHFPSQSRVDDSAHLRALRR